MISQLTGRVVKSTASWAVLDVAGVGFKVLCPPATAASLTPGELATLATSLVVREDSLTLFGFADDVEREAFELVQSASGIGPKIALAVVSVLPPDRLVAAIRQEDVRALTAVPGIGAKGAQRLIVDLKDKVAQLGVMVADAPVSASPRADDEAWRGQVLAGLTGLGWPVKDAEAACEQISTLAQAEPQPSVGQLMKAALQTLAAKNGAR